MVDVIPLPPPPPHPHPPPPPQKKKNKQKKNTTLPTKTGERTNNIERSRVLCKNKALF